MLKCKACIRRCLRTLVADISESPRPLHSSHHHLLIHRYHHPPIWIRRGYATEAIPFEDVPARGPGLPPRPPTPYVGRADGPVRKEDSPYKKSALEKELRWLKDPLKLGDHTVWLLRGDKFQKALEIVRMASKEMECTVSWNHLIDYEMSKGRVRNATKVYNEMKKRAQRPDGHTYTTLLRGFAWHAKFPLSAPRALSIYFSMYNENSPVKPNIIHTNAVLKVCALAGDIDGLFGVAAKLPPRGPEAPNSFTFTTILNAIRVAAADDVRGEQASLAKSERTSQAVLQGRRLWEEIRDRWTNGDVYIDEKLVCAMGRLLLLGDKKEDWDDILSLVEQTMNIRRQAPRRSYSRENPASREMEGSIEGNVDLQTLMPPDKQSEAGDEDRLLTPMGNAFAPIPAGPGDSRVAAVRPGRNTLSMLIDACMRLHLTHMAQNYWGILTNPEGQYNIKPDCDNYHAYLRLLRLQRASRSTVELLEEMRYGKLDSRMQLQTKTFRIAISACARDKRNKNSLGHATKLVKMMIDTLPHPDARALSMYLNLAMSQPSRDWRTLMGVIHDTELGVRNLRSLLAYDPKGDKKQSEEDVQALVKGLIGAFDVVLDLGNEEMGQEEKAKCREQRHILKSYITKAANRMAAEDSYRKANPRKDVTEDEGEEDTADDAEDRKVDSRAYTPPGFDAGDYQRFKMKHRAGKRVERREEVKRAVERKRGEGADAGWGRGEGEGERERETNP
ncbi:hypothetical protein N7G274_000536 [Stereocaulon virgatum]|uniref:Pentatricopeptide repeat protein n=1 Tax=Stereocaulon virgatum TaxID=373712 RepID=A0ABR4ASV9_9LECA